MFVECPSQLVAAETSKIVRIIDIVNKPGTKSVVWEYSGTEKLENGGIADDSKAICRSCRRSITAKHGNTSNLLTHLKIHHAHLFIEVSAAMKSGKSREAVVLL